MSILKYKYKAHKLVNTLFYVAVFGIGFILGFGAEKLDFNKLLSQVLMIDNVKAYNITSTIDEDYIVEMFSQDADFDITIYKNIFCLYDTKSTYSQYCYAFTDDALSKTTFSYSTSGNIDIRLQKQYIYNISPSPAMMLNFKTNEVTKQNIYNSDIWITQKYSSYKNLWYFGFIPDGFNESSWFGTRHLLDFSKYSVKLEYNENLFKDNSDFKQVCVTPETRFAITSNNITYTNEETGLKFFNGIDFIWFSYVPDGLTTYLYSSAEETKKTPLTEDGPLFNGINPGKWYYLDEKEEIDKFFNTDSSKGEIYPGTTLKLESYTDKYSYFGWYFHPFVVHFDNTETDESNNFFNVFHFKDKLNFYSTLENGLDYYEELENARNGNVCFYIKNDYDVTILNKDIFDDDIGETTILGGDEFDINTTENSSSLNSKGLFSKINLFINNIKDTILFINGYIYELYVSLPNIVQLFIVAVFGLIVVRILVGMVTK